MRSHRTLLGAVAAVGALVLLGCAPTMQTKWDVAKNSQKSQKYAEAIKAYNEYLADAANKDSMLLPHALYEIGVCQQAMGDKPAAMAAYKKVIDQYPASDPAKWASVDMKRLEGMELTPPKPATAPTPKPATAPKPAPAPALAPAPAPAPAK